MSAHEGVWDDEYDFISYSGWGWGVAWLSYQKLLDVGLDSGRNIFQSGGCKIFAASTGCVCSYSQTHVCVSSGHFEGTAQADVEEGWAFSINLPKMQLVQILQL